MTATIFINERNIDPFASQQHALAIVEALGQLGWGVAYSEQLQAWQFPTLASFNRFSGDLENVLDQIAGKVGFAVTWDCGCKEDDPSRCQCGKGRGHHEIG